MMRLFLVEKLGGRRIDLGLFKFNDEANCINAARRKHRFLDKLETNGFEFEGVTEAGPLRREKPKAVQCEQLTIAG